jgi:hypothetical protein
MLDVLGLRTEAELSDEDLERRIWYRTRTILTLVRDTENAARGYNAFGDVFLKVGGIRCAGFYDGKAIFLEFGPSFEVVKALCDTYNFEEMFCGNCFIDLDPRIEKYLKRKGITLTEIGN